MQGNAQKRVKIEDDFKRTYSWMKTHGGGAMIKTEFQVCHNDISRAGRCEVAGNTKHVIVC